MVATRRLRGAKDHGVINLLPYLGRGVKRCLGIPRRQGHGSIAAGVLLILCLVFIQSLATLIYFFTFFFFLSCPGTNDTDMQGKGRGGGSQREPWVAQEMGGVEEATKPP